MSNQQGHPIASIKPTIGSPAIRALEAEGYIQLEQLDGVSENYLAGLHGVGPKAIRLLKSALAEKGLALGK